MRSILPALLTALLLLSCCPCPVSAAEAAPAQKELTIMIYMCGSNLESDGGAATADITEILRSRYNSDAVNVVAMLGGTRKWWGGMDAQQTAVYEISGNRPRQVWSDGLLNMGDPATLSELLDYGHENYPAEDYALILWNHGGGPMSGVCWDDLSQSDNLTMTELVTALEDSPFVSDPLEWIGFDACLMASVETAHLMAPYANYMIASQETEPGTGWSYSFLSGIENDENGGVTGTRIIDSYMENTPVQEGLTLSCTDLSKVMDVESAMDAFFGDLTVDLTEDTFSALSNMRQGVHGYGRSENASSDLDLVDLSDLVTHYEDQAEDSAAALQTAISEAVISTRSTEENSCGLSVYHPYYNKVLYQSMGQEEYSSFFFSPGYTQYMQRFSALWLGESMSDWSKLAPAAESFTEDNQAQFTFQLSGEQQANFASAQLLVLSEYEDPDNENGNSFSQVYITPDVTVDENGLLSAIYTGRTLYCVNENGEPLTGCLYYFIDGEYTVIPANYISFESGLRYYTLLYCTGSETADDLEVSMMYVYDEGSQQFTNRLTIDPTEFEDIIFPTSHYFPTWDGDVFLAFEDWTRNDDLLSGYELYKYVGDWHFHFFDELLSGDQLYATFQVTDTQANTYSTELTQVINPNLAEIPIEPSEISSDLYQMQLSARVDSSKLDPEMTLMVNTVNPTDKEMIYEIRDLRINGTRSVSDYFYTHLKAGESDYSYVRFSGTDLANLDRVSSLEGTLTVTEYDGFEVVEEVPLSFTLDADVSAFSSAQDTENVLAQTEADGLEFQLLSVTEDTSGKLSMDLHVTNRLDEPAEFDLQQIAVNGFGTKVYKTLTIGAGEDIYTTLEFDSDVSYFDFFDHTGGSNHLVRHALLSWYGVTQIEEISLLADTSRADLVLDEPVPYEQKPTDNPAHPVLLYDNRDLQVYLEQVWVIDRDVILSVEIQNHGDNNRKLSLEDAAVDGDTEQWVIFETYYAKAGITTHDYVQFFHSDSDDYDILDEETTEAQTEAVTEEGTGSGTASGISFTIHDGADLYDVTISFPEPVPFNTDGGVLMDAPDVEITCTDTLAGGSSGPVLLSEVLLPEDAFSHSRDISLQLTEEQMDGLTSARAALVAVCDPDYFSSDEPVEGRILMTIERTDLDIAPDGTLSGTLQGIYPAIKGSGLNDCFFQIESLPNQDGFAFAPILDASIFSDVFPWLYFNFIGTANKENETVGLKNIQIFDNYPLEGEPSDYSDQPVSRFTACSLTMVFSEMIENGPDSFIYRDGGSWPMMSDFTLDDSIQLEMRPAESLLESPEYESLGIVYQLFYDDSKPVLTDIYPLD